MKLLFVGLLTCVLTVAGPAVTPQTFEGEQATFTLPDGRAGSSYRVEIEAVLREKYRVKLAGNSRDSILQWAMVDGDLPSGLTLRTDGILIGALPASGTRTYRFRVKVVDVSVPDESLELNFLINVKASALRLVKISGPMLVPLDTQATAPKGGENVLADSTQLANSTSSRILSSVPSPSSPTASLHWVAPAIASGSSIADLTQSPYPLSVGVDAANNECLLEVLVLKKQDGSFTQLIDHKTQEINGDKPAQDFEVPLAKGDNKVVVNAYKRKKASDKCAANTPLASLDFVESINLLATCDTGNCGKPTPPTQSSNLSSRNFRAILGVEQTGASSAASAQNPFLDFFFNAELKSQVGIWGDVRLTTTPQQVAAFASSAPNTVGAATGDKINDLATSFDFKIGPEFRFNPDAKTGLSLIAGFGAISTLTGPPKTAPIFKIPANTSVQYDNFVNQYPEAKTPGAVNIAFVPEEQDRFYRQYFLGLRVRSYHQDDGFPSLFDVTFGQNSAVTGGKLRHFVLGFEGSHSIPLVNNSVYVFGSANLKIGGPKFRNVPFVLEPADASAKLSDSNVVITSRQSNRDFYRIGFGVDLIELFKPKKKEGE